MAELPFVFVTQTAYAGGGMEHWLVALTSGLKGVGREVKVLLVEGARFHSPLRFLDRHPLSVETRVVRADLGLREERVLALLRAIGPLRGAIIIPVGIADTYDAVGMAKKDNPHLRLVPCIHGNAAGALTDVQRNSGFIDAAVSVSKRGADMLVGCTQVPMRRVYHIPFGIENHPSTREERQQDSSSRRRPLRAAYVGRLEQTEKRALDLIGIVRAMRTESFHLDIVGEGPAQSQLQHELSADVGAGRVTFHGYLSTDRLHREIYASVDVLLITSPAEGGPIVAWEAMSYGVVPIVSDFIGRREEPIWRPGVNCLVFPVGDCAAAVVHLRSLLDVRIRQRLRESASNLPPSYLRSGFIGNWCQVADDVSRSAPRCQALPRRLPTSSGRLRELPILRIGLRQTQRRLGLRVFPSDAGSEWPGTYPEKNDHR